MPGLKASASALPALLIGALAFVAITRGAVLDPGYIDWVMNGDAATHYLGWEFFRHTPIFQWPLGANRAYGLDLGSSIVYTDSIPLLAFVFKPIDPWLPDRFQFLGLSMLCSFMLQALFSWKLLALFTPDRWLPLIGAVFFVIAPAMLHRLHGHTALVAHWTIVAALYLYFAPGSSNVRWIVLLGVAATIHAYFLVMVAALWAADQVQRLLRKVDTPSRVAIRLLATGTFVALTAWAAGYFMISAGLDIYGFGHYRMNLLSPIDSDDTWSRLLPDQKGGPGDYEGFNFLGSGMLGLLLAAAGLLIARGPPGMKPGRRVVPLLVVALLFFLYSISNRVALGSHELFSYALPPAIARAAATFRVSGRFFWPDYYLIYLFVFYVLFTRLRRNSAVVLCSVMCVAQIADSVDMWKQLGNRFTQSPKWASPMTSPAWREIGIRYRKIIFVLPRNQPAGWIPLSQFAASHRMAINTGYFARIDPGREVGARSQLSRAILDNAIEHDALYVFEDEALWQAAARRAAPLDAAGTLDGFRILAPGLRNCTSCDLAAIRPASISASPGVAGG